MGIIRKLVNKATDENRRHNGPNEVGIVARKGKLLVEHCPALPRIGDRVNIVRLFERHSPKKCILLCSVTRDCTVKGTPYKDTKKHPLKITYNGTVPMTNNRVQIIFQFVSALKVPNVKA